MDKVGYRASLSDAERVILTWHVAILTGQRIASHLDRPGYGRSTALVRSVAHLLLATSTDAHKNSLSSIKSILLRGQDRRRRFMVHFYPLSVPSSLSPLSPLMRDIVTFFLIFVIALANRSQVLGWPDIWNEDIIDLPWFGEYPGYPGGPLYTRGPQLENQGPQVQGGQMVVNGSVVQQQPGYSIIIWPGVNGEPPRIEQRPGVVTHSTLSS
jgi:hypothetical protein